MLMLDLSSCDEFDVVVQGDTLFFTPRITDYHSLVPQLQYYILRHARTRPLHIHRKATYHAEATVLAERRQIRHTHAILANQTRVKCQCFDEQCEHPFGLIALLVYMID